MAPAIRPPRRSAAQLGCRLLAHLARALLLAGAAALPAPARAVDLAGTWYVLVHYRDADGPDPGAQHWSDAVWRFEQPGEARLDWSWYPSVLFDEQEGRFAMVDRQRLARVEHAWEPSPAQRREIAEGLRVQPRGAVTKSLRRRGDGFRSLGAARTASTSVIGYAETWRIESPDARPVFVRSAAMGSARTARLEGATRFEVETISEDGDELRGRYRRDESQRGTFRMWRAGPVRSLEADPREAPPEPSARFLAGRLLGPRHHVAALEALAARGDDEALRAEVRRRIELAMRDAGESPERHARFRDRLVDEVSRRLASEPASVERLEALWSQGRLLR